VFVKWDDGTTNNTITITVPPIIVTLDIYTNIVRTAYFAATANITVVTIQSTVASSVAAELSGRQHKPDCRGASNGWAFTGWSDGYTNFCIASWSHPTRRTRRTLLQLAP